MKNLKNPRGPIGPLFFWVVLALAPSARGDEAHMVVAREVYEQMCWEVPGIARKDWHDATLVYARLEDSRKTWVVALVPDLEDGRFRAWATLDGRVDDDTLGEALEGLADFLGAAGSIREYGPNLTRLPLPGHV